MSIFNRITSIARSVMNSPEAKRAMRRAAREVGNRVSGEVNRRSGERRQRTANPERGSILGPNDNAIEYNVDRFGVPEFLYAPANDGDADPGEVCWTWVPYEDDPNQGKDRPVVILSREGDLVVFAQMTSKDHDSGREGKPDHLGRVWFNIGTGAWDNLGRESEVRIDRLLVAHKNSIRREGAVLDKTRFTQLTDAVADFHA